MSQPHIDAIHRVAIPVRWSDFDRHGRLLHTVYLEASREALLRFAEDQFPTHEFLVFQRRVELDFQRPVRPSSRRVIVDTSVTGVGTTSFTTLQDIKDHEGTVCARVLSVHVATDTASAEPREITSQERRVLTQIAESAC